MLDNVIVVTSSSELYSTIQAEFLEPLEGNALCRTVLPQLKTTDATLLALRRPRRSIDLLVIEATTPSCGESADGECGDPTLRLLKELATSKTKCLVLLSHRMEAIEAYCASSELCYALYTRDFLLGSLRAVLIKLGVDSEGPRSSDVTVEIEIGDRLSKLRILDGGREQNREVPVPNYNSVRSTADSFRTWRMFETVEEAGCKKTRAVPAWRDHLKQAGMALYDNLVRGVLGEGLLQEYIQRPAGLLGLHFRFHIGDSLFSAPFEALYDATTESFIRIRSPLTRRLLIASGVRPNNDNRRAQLSRDLNILFVRAQVDGTAQIVDEKGEPLGHSNWFEFEPLKNLELEEELFRKQIDGHSWHSGKIVVEYFPRKNDNTIFVDGLRHILETRQFDCVHFAGHSLTTDTDQTFLIVPGQKPYALSALPVSAFAQWCGAADVRFVYLSSCRGGSCRAVQNLVTNGIPDVFGFRWDVEDEMAAKFAEVFYQKLLLSEQSIAKAYRDACESLHNDPERRTSPIWVSSILIMQTDDWWRRSA
ncbi:CHAT domain-containing protein [Bradyrhizobium sp. UFLA05-109]